MQGTRRPFLLAECDVIRAGYADHLTTAEIVEKLNGMPCNEEKKRNNYQVLKFIKEAALTRPKNIPARTLRARLDPFIVNKDDLKFKRAMLAARDSEKFVIGVFKDRRPLHVPSIVPEPMFSGCSSGAALCAEVGGKRRELTEAD